MPPTRVGATKLMDEDSRHRTRPVWNHSDWMGEELRLSQERRLEVEG